MTPEIQELLFRWRKGEVWERQPDDVGLEHLDRTWGEDNPYHPSVIVYVPFEHGTLATGLESSVGDNATLIRVLREMAESVSLGFERASHRAEQRRAERALAQRAEEFSRSNAKLERFAYVASHDLQEPLRMVSSFLQLLSRRYSGKLDEDADEFIAYAVDGASRMRGLIEALLEYSRVGTRTLSLKTVSFDDLFQQVLRDLSVRITESGAVVTHDPLPTMIADEIGMGQLLQNLIGNAIKFRGESEPRVYIGVEERQDEWIFSVTDNGIGMEAQDHESVFSIFKRLVAREDYEGTGIGLSVCRKIVERQGGHIWVESSSAQGSTFCFTIPTEVPGDDDEN